MLGGMLAGHDESEGEVVNGKIQFYGMSSDAAMATHGTRKDGYRGAEGKVVELPHKGAVEKTVIEILGGLRSTCTYIGAKRIKDMPKCTTFVRCTQQVNQVFNQFNAD
jgi:GMP reductase